MFKLNQACLAKYVSICGFVVTHAKIKLKVFYRGKCNLHFNKLKVQGYSSLLSFLNFVKNNEMLVLLIRYIMNCNARSW